MIKTLLRKAIVPLLGFAVVVLVLLLATPHAIHAAVAALVEVVNTSSNPVLARSVDNPALHPFRASAGGSQLFFSFPVPAGNTLVIEQIYFLCQEPTATAFPTDYRLVVNGIGFFFAPTTLVLGDKTELITNQVTNLYADGGTTVDMGTGSGSPAGSSCEASVVGHLVSSL